MVAVSACASIRDVRATVHSAARDRLLRASRRQFCFTRSPTIQLDAKAHPEQFSAARTSPSRDVCRGSSRAAPARRTRRVAHASLCIASAEPQRLRCASYRAYCRSGRRRRGSRAQHPPSTRHRVSRAHIARHERAVPASRHSAAQVHTTAAAATAALPISPSGKHSQLCLCSRALLRASVRACRCTGKNVVVWSMSLFSYHDAFFGFTRSSIMTPARCTQF